MNYLGAVNRILRSEGIIRGDDDAITAFSSTQHAHAIELAQIAVQNELTHLTSQSIIPYENAQDTITTVAGTRLYTLASDFVRFQPKPHLLEVDSSGSSLNSIYYPYPGGEDCLRVDDPSYQDTQGGLNHWYWSEGTAKKIGFYYVPDSVRYFRYYYQKSVSLSTETNTVPFTTTDEANVFVEICARRFKYLYLNEPERSQQFPRGLNSDPELELARSSLSALIRPFEPPRGYGRRYG